MRGRPPFLTFFTFSRVEFWVNVPRLPPQPSIDPQGSLRSERGSPRFRAHAPPSGPCRTGCKKGQGRQAGQGSDRRKRHSQAGFFIFLIFFRAVPLHVNWTLSGSGVTKSIPVDDSHLSVDVPSDYPERIPSVASGGVQPEMVGPAGVL